MKKQMRTMGLVFGGLLSVLLSQTGFAAQSPAEHPLIGAWELEKFVFLSKDGKETPFCKDATGLILYEKSGHMSVSINCGPHPAGTEKSPADDYGGMLFYAGEFEIRGDEVVHHVTNSSSAALIGKTLIRKLDTVTSDSLVLTGNIGGDGQSLRIEWRRKLATRTLASPSDALALLTYIKVKPGMEKRFMAEVATIVKVSRSEPGNIAWYVQQSQEDSTEFVFYTRWVNEAALDYHLKSAPLVEYIARTAEMMAPGHPAKLVRFWPVDMGRVN